MKIDKVAVREKQSYEMQRMIDRQKVDEIYCGDEINRNDYPEGSPSQQPLKQDSSSNSKDTEQFLNKKNDNKNKYINGNQHNQGIEMSSKSNVDVIQSSNLLLKDDQFYAHFPKTLQKNNFAQKKQNSLNFGDRALLIRRVYRIFLLFLFEAIIVGLFISFFYKFGFFRGEYQLGDNENISIQMKSCVLKINDYSNSLFSSQDLNFYSITKVPSQISKNMLLRYSYPSPQTLGYSSDMSYKEENGNKIFNFINGGSFQDCEIAIYVYEQSTIDNLTVDCGRDDCFIIMNSKTLKFNKISVVGYSIDFNSQYLDVNYLKINSFFGYAELNDISFQQADIDMSTGDIAVQSTKSILANLEMVSKLYCATTYSNINIVSTVTDTTPTCTDVYPFGSSDRSSQNIVAQRCISGSVTVKSSGSEANQILNAKNTFGNIFINVLEQAGASASLNQQIFYDKTVYGSEGDSIDLSSQSQQSINSEMAKAANPNVYDPIFQIVIGSKFTFSNTYTQWQATFNPAYSYLKPWWIGTLTFTLLNTQYYYDELTIAPGFCPYVPSLSKERILKVQDLLKKYLVQNQDERRILTFGWLDQIALPSLKFITDSIYNGIRQINLNSNYLDSWINFKKDKDGTILINSLTLDNNQVLLAAIIVSFILALIVGIVFMVVIVFVINQNYLYTLDHMKHVDTYAQIQNLKKSSNSVNLYNDDEDASALEFKANNENDQKTKDDEELKRIANKDQNQIKYSISGILNLFTTLVYLSPPLSAYIDQVVLLFYKARKNSASSFFQLLFVQEKKYDETVDEQIHNLEKDSISGQEMKALYEQYCYLNSLLERKLDSQQSLNLLKSKGFKISIKQGALISYYSYVMYNGNNKVIQQSEDKGSLDLFIKYCCKLTNFDSDSIDSLTFEKHYFEFCNKNHLEPTQLNERELKREYGIETRFLPQQVVERDQNQNYRKNNQKYNIDKNRVLNNFMLMLSQNIQNEIPENGNINELNEVIIDIYTPQGWIFYDILTVLAHLSIIFLIGCPVLILVIFVRMQQSPYSLIPLTSQLQMQKSYLFFITFLISNIIIFNRTDLLYNTSVIPMKLMNDNALVQAITIISLIFWILSSWDLIYYYLLMSFPQERYFQNYKNARYVRKLVSRIMWVIVLIAIYLIVIYLCLAITWLILGAIINPEAFLPYASSAATLVTLVTKKYRQFKNISEEGFKKMISYIQEFSEKQFKDIIKKMDIAEKIEDALPTNQIKNLVGEAENMNLIDPKLSQSIQNNIQIMTRDPNAVAYMGQEVFEIAQNPQLYATNLMNKLEQKVKEELAKQVEQYLPRMSQSLIQSLQNLFTGQKQRLKQDLTILFKDLVSEFETNQQLKDNPQSQVLIKSLNILKGPIISLVFDIAFPNKDEKIEDIKQKMIKNICSLIQEIIRQQSGKEIKLKPIVNLVGSVNVSNLFEQITFFNLKLFKYQTENEHQEYLKIAMNILSNQDLVAFSDKLQKISLFTEILNLLINVVEDKGTISILPTFDKILTFIQTILGTEIKKLHGINSKQFIQFIIECFFSPVQALPLPKFAERKQLCSSMHKLYSNDIESAETIEKMGSITAFFSYWMQSQSLNIPTDAINDILSILKDKFPDYDELYSLLKSSKDSSNKNNSKLIQKLKKFQTFFNLFDILTGDPLRAQQKLLKCSKKLFGVSQKFKDFISSCMKLKYENLSSENDFLIISESEYFEKISKSIKLHQIQLSGLLKIYLNKPESTEAISCMKSILFSYRINENRIPIFIHLHQLILSEDENILNNSLSYFKFNSLGIYIEKISLDGKNKSIVQVDSEIFALILLFLRGKFNDHIRTNTRIFKMLSELFSIPFNIDYIKAEQYQQLLQKLQFHSTLITQVNLQEEFAANVEKLLILEKQGVIGQKILGQIIKVFQIGNLENTVLAKIKIPEIQVFSKLLSLRNIPQIYPEIQTQIFKDSIQEIASLLNVDEYLIQNFFILFTSSSAERVAKAFKKFGQELSNEEETTLRSFAQAINKIEEKETVILDIKQSLFKSKIPLHLMKQLTLFNKLPSDSETLYFFLNAFYDSIPEKVKMMINFHYNIPTAQKQKSLHSQIENVILNQSDPKEKENLSGLKTILMMFNNGALQEDNTQIFLQYLHDSKKSLPMLIGCLYSYFNGNGDSTQFFTDSQLGTGNSHQSQKFQISVEQYLSRRLDIKSEFFSSLPCVFVKDTYIFAYEFIKFFRQVDYQIQREAKQGIQKVTKQQVADLSQLQNQSLKRIDSIQINKNELNENQPAGQPDSQINRVTIQDKELEQFLRLVSGNSINTSFFSRELSLPIDVIELIQMICLIKNSDEEKRQKTYETLAHSSSIQKVFSQIGIEMDEFITCIKFFYQDFEVSESSILQKGLKLPSKFPFSELQNLLLLDVYLPPFEDPVVNRKKLNSFLRSNQLLKDMKINVKWLSLLFVLYGDFTVLKTFAQGEVLMVSSEEKNSSINILLALFGTINKKKTEIKSGDFFKQIYKKLKDQHKLRGQFDEEQMKNKTIKNSDKEEGILSSNCLQKGNTFEYGVYLLCKELYISPIWVLLMSGNEDTWGELAGTYYGYYKYEKQTKSHNNPIQALILILRMKECPTLIKEFLVQNELGIVSPTIYDSETKKTDPIITELLNKNNQLIQEQNNILENILKRKIESFTELAQKVQFPQKILTLIASYEYSDNRKYHSQFKFSENEVETILQQSSKEIPIANRQKSSSNLGEGEENTYSIVKNIFKKVEWDFCDYEDKIKSKLGEDEYTHKKTKEFFGCNEMMQLVFVSTLSNLQTAYYGLHNLSDRDSDHYKLAAYEIDLFLSTLEQFYFFSEKVSQISKFKLFYLIGLASGFIFDVKDALNCLPSQSIFDHYYKDKQISNYEEQMNFFKDKILSALLQTMNLRGKQNENIVQEKDLSYFRVFYNHTYERIATQHTNQISQNIFEMYVDNFDDFILPCISGEGITSIYELYLKKDKEFQKLENEEKQYQAAVQDQNFRFLVDFYKENYDGILQNEYFLSRFEKDLNYYIGVLNLNASFISAKGDVEQDAFVDALSLVSQYLVSNKRSLIQITSLFINGIDFNMSCIHDVIQLKSQSLKCFANIYLNQNNYFLDNEIEYLLSQTSYSETNKWVIKNIMQLYLGDLSKIMSIVNFSQYFSSSQHKSYQELYKFLFAIDYNNLHQISSDSNKINILNLQFLSSEKEENDELQDEIIFQICNSIIHSNGLDLDSRIQINDDSSSHKFMEQYYKLTKIIRDICSNNWDFINELQNDSITKNAFCSLFDLSPMKIDLIETLSLIKPDISGLKGDPRLDTLLSPQNIQKSINKLKPFGFGKTQEEEQQLKILIYIANESFSHLVNELSQMTNNSSPEQVMSINKQELAVLFQSILMIKNCTQINWLSLHKQIKKVESVNFHLNIVNDSYTIEQLQNFMRNVFNGFDVMCAIFLNDISAIKNEDATEIFSQNSGSTSRSIDTRLRLFDVTKLEKGDNFQLEIFQKIMSREEQHIYSKSQMSLWYLLKAFKFIEKQTETKSISFRYFYPNAQDNAESAQIILKQSDNEVFSRKTCQKLTSIICGAPFFLLAKNDEFLKKIKLVSNVLMFEDWSLFLNIIKDKLFAKNGTPIDTLFCRTLTCTIKLFYIGFSTSFLNDEVKKELYPIQMQSISELLFSYLENDLYKQKMDKSNNFEQEFIQSICELIIKDADSEGTNELQKFNMVFINCLNEAFPEIGQFFKGEKINQIYQIIQDLLDRPLLNLEDKNLYKDLLELLSTIDNELIDKQLVKSLINMIVFSDFKSLLEIIEYSNIVSDSEFKIIKESIIKISNLSIFQNRGALQDLRSNIQPVLTDQMKDISKRIQDGKINIADMFYSIDSQGDGNGKISMVEFCNFLRRTGIQMSEHRINELFATIKKNRRTIDDKSDGNQLNYEEFEEAYQYINNKKTDMSLEKLGISPALLALSLGTLITILILLLVFIFLGIKAFALGGTFGSIINSIIPVVATTGTAQTQNNKSNSLKEDNIKDVMKETQLILHSDQL